jgi:hypothetical protein
MIVKDEFVKIGLRVEMMEGNGRDRGRHGGSRRFWPELCPEIDDLVGSPLTLFKPRFIFLSAPGELSGEGGDVGGCNIDNLTGQIDQGNIEKALFKVGSVYSQSVV